MKNVIVLIACVIVAHLSYSHNSSTVDVDEKSYQTVKIGTQWWMAENLQVVHFNNGDVIPKIKKGLLWKELATPAYSYYDNKTKKQEKIRTSLQLVRCDGFAWCLSHRLACFYR